MYADRELKYPRKWQTRFVFFDRHGAPNTKAYRAALKQETFLRRILIRINFIAFFFGFIYFFLIGLWRKALSMLALSYAINRITELLITKALMWHLITLGGAFLLNIAISLVYMLLYMVLWGLLANYAWYLKEVKNSTSWNPFEGFL
ncbi:DUF2628 domain-containing protein [Affinibrenneria salicis]|uniref:DUF2628 domain-containing protein n=2 Tax=Affinibrenneria salicis TaxID=2590031 RepID=A0A5J5FWR2_9GAMM|nr:DUF2628 domain-containing protein [Affinibrenneria salicis]